MNLAARIALRHAGAWYGHSVNLASRITGIAPPQTVLATREVCDTISDAFRYEPWQQVTLKGIDDPVALYTIAAV